MDKKGRKILHKTLAGFLVSVMLGTTAVPAAAAEETAGTGAVVYESESENELDGEVTEGEEPSEEVQEETPIQSEQAEIGADDNDDWDDDRDDVTEIILNRSSLNFTKKGQTAKLIATLVSDGDDDDDDIDWESSNERVARVSDDGLVTAVNNGTATIWAKEDDVRASCKVTVNGIKPDQVTNVSVKSWGATAVKISWTPIYNADGYHVYRATSKNGTYRQVARLLGSDVSSFINRSLTTGRTYYYKVRAFEDGICGAYSTIKTGKAVPKQVKISKVQSWGYNGLKITWGKVAGADGYRLYRATSPNGKFTYVTQINSGSTCSYVNSKLTTGQKYYYKMRAFKKYAGSYHFGAMSAVTGNVAPKLKQAVITKVVPGYEKVTLSWNKVNGAIGYQIYYREADDDDWDYVKELRGTTYTHRDDDLGDDVYYYKVRAIRYENGKKQYGTFSEPKRVRVPDYDDDRWDDDDDRWDDDDDRWDDDWDD